MEKQEILYHQKNIPSNKLVSNLFSKTITFTKFLAKVREREFPQVWNFPWNQFLTSLHENLFSRDFWVYFRESIAIDLTIFFTFIFQIWSHSYFGWYFGRRTKRKSQPYHPSCVQSKSTPKSGKNTSNYFFYFFPRTWLRNQKIVQLSRKIAFPWFSAKLWNNFNFSNKENLMMRTFNQTLNFWKKKWNCLYKISAPTMNMSPKSDLEDWSGHLFTDRRNFGGKMRTSLMKPITSYWRSWSICWRQVPILWSWAWLVLILGNMFDITNGENSKLDILTKCPGCFNDNFFSIVSWSNFTEKVWSWDYWVIQTTMLDMKPCWLFKN